MDISTSYNIVTRLREANNKLPAQQTESEDAAHEELRKKIEIQRLLRGFQRECPRQQTLSAGSGQVFLLLKRKLSGARGGLHEPPKHFP